MESVPQRPGESSAQDAILTILHEQANALARSTGFIVRQRQLSGASFASLLILGWLHDPEASLDALSAIRQQSQCPDQCGSGWTNASPSRRPCSSKPSSRWPCVKWSTGPGRQSGSRPLHHALARIRLLEDLQRHVAIQPGIERELDLSESTVPQPFSKVKSSQCSE